MPGQDGTTLRQAAAGRRRAEQALELQRLSAESVAYLESNGRAIRLSAAFIPLIRFAILFAFLAILLVGGFKALNGDLAVGTYSVLVFITQRLLWPLTGLGRTLDEYQRSMARTRSSARRVGNQYCRWSWTTWCRAAFFSLEPRTSRWAVRFSRRRRMPPTVLPCVVCTFCSL